MPDNVLGEFTRGVNAPLIKSDIRGNPVKLHSDVQTYCGDESPNYMHNDATVKLTNRTIGSTDFIIIISITFYK